MGKGRALTSTPANDARRRNRRPPRPHLRRRPPATPTTPTTPTTPAPPRPHPPPRPPPPPQPGAPLPNTGVDVGGIIMVALVLLEWGAAPDAGRPRAPRAVTDIAAVETAGVVRSRCLYRPGPRPTDGRSGVWLAGKQEMPNGFDHQTEEKTLLAAKSTAVAQPERLSDDDQAPGGRRFPAAGGRRPRARHLPFDFLTCI